MVFASLSGMILMAVFDVPAKELELRRGEVLIDSIDGIEDTKGNNGDKGDFLISNLRLIWISQRNRKTNLSIGYNPVLSINVRTATSRLRGSTQALYVLTKFNGSRFEFIFTNMTKNNPRMFSTIQVLGVWNLSSDQGNLGTFVATNVRLVWFANLAENFNVSIPYLQMKSIRIRDSKFGPALVIETTARSGGYILGFRVDPQERMHEVFQEVQSLFQVYSVNPTFGVEYAVEDRSASLDKVTVPRQMDDVEIIDDRERDAVMAYYADGVKNIDREPVYCPELGLAIESLPEDMTLEQLWNVL
eukprot:jgi/Chlat1/5629/Chrsp369S05412